MFAPSLAKQMREVLQRNPVQPTRKPCYYATRVVEQHINNKWVLQTHQTLWAHRIQQTSFQHRDRVEANEHTYWNTLYIDEVYTRRYLPTRFHSFTAIQKTLTSYHVLRGFDRALFLSLSLVFQYCYEPGIIVSISDSYVYAWYLWLVYFVAMFESVWFCDHDHDHW